MNLAQEVGNRIRYYRKSRGMTLEELAIALGKTKSCLSKYESGSIAVDIVTLYALAHALEISVSQLLVSSPSVMQYTSTVPVPAFFAGFRQFFMYYYDGRSNHICSSVIDLTPSADNESQDVMMYMNIRDFNHYQQCENTYSGSMIHYDSLSIILLQNRDMEMDHYQISVPSPYLNAPVKWGLAYGISSRPLMPTSAKVLLSKAELAQTPELERELHISKEDIRLLRMYNMLTVL